MTTNGKDPLNYKSTTEIAEVLKIKPQTLRYWRSKGKGPHYYRISKSRVIYDIQDVLDWLEKSRVSPEGMVE